MSVSTAGRKTRCRNTDLLATDKAFGVKDGARGVVGRLIFSGISDETLVVREGNVRRCDAVALVVGDNFHLAVDVHADARIGGAQVDADHRAKLLRRFICESGPQKTHGGKDCGEFVGWGVCNLLEGGRSKTARRSNELI